MAEGQGLIGRALKVFTTKQADDGTVHGVLEKSLNEESGYDLVQANVEWVYAKLEGIWELAGYFLVNGVDNNDGSKTNPKGIVRKRDIESLQPTTVPIPANFAGLEAIMVPTRIDDQLFRIVEVIEDEDCVTVTARHVWYDNLQNYTTWHPTGDVYYTGAAACRNILTNAISPCSSRVASDSTNQRQAKVLDFDRKNLVEAFLDPEKGVCKMYGLSLIRNNWDFYCLRNVGYDRGVIIQDGKNLLGVERKESIENLATRIAPIGKNEKGKIVWLNYNGKKYIDSPHVGEYSYPRVEIYDTGLQIGKNGVTANNINTKLRQAAQDHLTKDKVDIPEVEMTVEFISLGDTEEYKQYRDLDKVYLYDILTVVDKKRGYSYTAQVNAVEHDVLTGQLLSVTIGSLKSWNGTRKVATWQVPEVDGGNIRVSTIMEGSFSDGAIQSDDIGENVILYAHIADATIDSLNADAIEAVTAHIQEIIAGKITADSIDTDEIDAINAKLGTAEIADARIAQADIDYAKVKDLQTERAIIETSITEQGTANHLFINRLMVTYGQMVQATIGDLVIGASNGNYYHVDVSWDQYGVPTLVPTQVTVTQAEIDAGHTSDGETILGNVGTYAELSSTDFYAINGIIDRITAKRIDVDQLFARQAVINHLNTADISNNNYIQVAVRQQLGQGKVYNQIAEPQNPSIGDTWYQITNEGGGVPTKWEDLEGTTWAALESGKNLLNDSDLKRGYYGSSGGYSGNTKYISYMVTLPAGTYTFSSDLQNCYVTRYLVDNVNHGVSSAVQSLTFTLENEATFKITTRNTSTSEIGDITPHAQIEVGSSATTYVPFVGHGTKWFELEEGTCITRLYTAIGWVQIDSYANARIELTNDRISQIVDDGEGQISGIKIRPAGIDLDGDKYIRMNAGGETSMELSKDGIDMKTAGKAFIHAADESGSGILFGDDPENAAFYVGNSGDVKAGSVEASEIINNGVMMLPVIVSEEKPEGHNIIWLRPSSTTSKRWTVNVAEPTYMQNTGGLGKYRTFTIAYTAGEYLAGSVLRYGVKASMKIYKPTNETAILRCSVKNGNNWIVIGQASKRVLNTGFSVTLDVPMTGYLANVMDINGGNLVVRLDTNLQPANCKLNTSFTFSVYDSSAGGTTACNAYFIE